ncbi:MAG: hypothetical protein HOH66_12805 [Rhodospirillaceae bacterium]|jgi:hypothetical protein|nr:hypothetical protein [Rhodospirillaceae bacterium]
MIRPLGCLRLNNGPIALPGSPTQAESYPFPVILEGVPGAWTENVTRGDRSVRDAYVESARRMEARGCAAVVTTCGFTSLFQADMAAAVSIPVASSSLLLVPFIRGLLPEGARIGILTYDATRLTDAHMEAAGWSPKEVAIAVDGAQGTESWEQMAEEQPELTVEMMNRDVGAAAERLIAKHPDIRALLFECTIFPIASDHVRARTGLPVYDYLTLARLTHEAAEAQNTATSTAARAAAE